MRILRLITIILALLGTSLTTFAGDGAKPSNILSATDKVYGLSKFWQEVNYNFVFLERVDKEVWDSTYRALIPLVQSTKDDAEYFFLLERFCGLLNDGHTSLWVGESERGESVYLAYMDYCFSEGFIRLAEVEGKVVVSSVSKDLNIPQFSEVIEVNDIPIEEYMARYVTPHISQNSEHTRRSISIRKTMGGLVGESRNLTVVNAETKQRQRVELTLTNSPKTYSPEELNAYPVKRKEGNKLLNVEWLENNIARLSLNAFSDWDITDEFDELLPELRNKAAGIIIDLRYNGGGSTNIGAYILQYLIPSDSIEGSKSRPRQHTSAYRAWGEDLSAEDTVDNEWATELFLVARGEFYHQLDHYRPKIRLDMDERIIRPTAILIGSGTASAAEDFLILADGQEHMTLIGEPTYGSTGQPLILELVGGIWARICTKHDYYPDGREFVGPGVIPDIEVKPTIKGLKNGRDEVLDRAIEHVKGEIKM